MDDVLMKMLSAKPIKGIDPDKYLFIHKTLKNCFPLPSLAGVHFGYRIEK